MQKLPNQALTAHTRAADDAFLVSLVVPIYNVEDFLAECLQSIETQTIFARTQVLLVDDGSTDSSHAIARDFAAEHSNVLLICQENAGLGAARNAGIASATAPTIAFLDSDDTLPANSLEIRVRAIEADGSDMVAGGMEAFPTRIRWPWSPCFAGESTVLNGLHELPELIHNASACNKLFKRAYFDEPGRLFAENTHFEDAYVVVPAMLAADKISVLAVVVYEYRMRPTVGSIMGSLFTRPENFWDHLRLNEKLAESLAGLSPAKQDTLRRFLIRSIQGFLLRAPDVLSGVELREYFSRSHGLYARFEPEEIVAGTHDLRHRIGFAALLLDSFDLFRDQSSAITGIDVVNRLPYVRIEPDVSPDKRILLRVMTSKAFLESASLDADRRHLELRGRIELPGVPLARPMHDLRLTVFSPNTRVRAATTLTARHGADPDRLFVNWAVRIPADRFESGSYPLRVRIHAGDDAFVVRLRPTSGFLRTSRAFRLTRLTLQVLPDDGQNVVVESIAGPGQRLRWFLRDARADIKQLVRRRPFGAARVIRLLTRPFFIGKDYWLIGERRNTAQDNGYTLFKWLSEKRGPERPRFILEKDSAAWAALDNRRHVVAHGSGWHKLLTLHAKCLVSSQDIDTYMLPRSWNPALFRRHLAPRLGSRRVFLQHGVTDKGVGPRLHRGITGVDVFVCSTERERGYLAEVSGYDSQLALTGMPRFDNLLRRGSEKRILIMPTWRNYLVKPSYSRNRTDPGTFTGSRFESFYASLLNDPRLNTCLSQSGYSVDFVPHYEVAAQFAGLVAPGGNVRVVSDGGASIQHLLRNSQLLVTDYSSVQFDAAYLGLPLVIAPFDEEEFYAGHYARGWFDHEADGLGPVGRTVEEVAGHIISYIERDCVRESLYADRAAQFFTHRDSSNSARVVDAIREAIAK